MLSNVVLELLVYSLGLFVRCGSMIPLHLILTRSNIITTRDTTEWEIYCPAQ